MGYDKKPLPVGVDNFEKLVTRGYYFIDKTNFMRDLLDLKGSVNLFTRPRRFGKTLNMSMLQYFFEDMRDGNGGHIDNTGLFEGLNIMNAGGAYLSQEDALFTGLNNLETISILDKRYDEYFGFTDSEVEALCEYYELVQHCVNNSEYSTCYLCQYRVVVSQQCHRIASFLRLVLTQISGTVFHCYLRNAVLGAQYETVKNWYNGYLFGESNVYNPWSVIRYVKDVSTGNSPFPKSYWANTSSNSIVRKLIERADDSVKGEIEHLIDGGVIEKPVHEDITYDEIYNTMDNMWNFMFFTGYFRKVEERMDDNDIRWLTMRLPNREVRYIFREKVISWFQEKIQEKDLTNLYTAFVNKDTDALEEELNQIMFETISSMDENEREKMIV